MHVGVEPSGDAFNAIELEPKTMRLYNGSNFMQWLSS